MLNTNISLYHFANSNTFAKTYRKFMIRIYQLTRGNLDTIFREFKKWRHQRQRQRHKSMLWLVERGKIIVLHVRRAFWWKFSTYSVKRQREIVIFEVLSTSRARSSKFFTLCLCMKIIRARQAKSVLCLFCTTWPTCNDSKTLNLAQSSILIWSFRCSSRRSFLTSLLN